MDGLLISSDVEVGAYKPEAVQIQEIVPPAYFIYILGAKPVGYLDEEKKKPVLISDENTGVKWFQDGALFEVAYQPAPTAKALYNQVQSSVTMLGRWLKKFDHMVWFAPLGAFDLEKYRDIPEIVEACIAGCNPDKNAVVENYKSRIVDISDWAYRGMGGHIHMSVPTDKWGDALHKYQRTILRMMIIYAGNLTVLTNTKPELELLRLEKFGHPGSYRTPIYPDGSYGFEYRAPSSSWLNSEEVMDIMYKAVDIALSLVLEYPDEAQEQINEFLDVSISSVLGQDKHQAEEILKIVKLI